MIIETMKQALEALEESVDLVRHEYTTDWRHGMPTRKAQLDGIKRGVEAHEQAITSLRQAIAEAEKQEPMECQHKRYSIDVTEQIGTCIDCGAEGRMRFVVDDTHPQPDKLAYYEKVADDLQALCDKQSLRIAELEKSWIGLNWDDLPEIYVGDKTFLHGAQWAEAKLREKNT